MPLPTTKAPLESSFTVGWICVLPKEYFGAHMLLDEEYPDEQITRARNDRGKYTLGRIGSHNVVLSVPASGKSGSIEASHIATMMRSTFPWLRLLLLVGIGGGVSTKDDDVRLGDIVLGTEIVDYSKGKLRQDGFERTGGSIKPPEEILWVFTILEGKIKSGLSLEKEIKDAANRSGVSNSADYARPTRDRLYNADYLHEDGCDCTNTAAPSSPPFIPRRPRVPPKRVVLHKGIIASANLVMKNAIRRDEIARETKCICFEMEAVGMTYVPNSLSIRGISDYSDGHKNDSWHDYASLAAAVGAREILRALSPSDLNRCQFYLSAKEVDSLINGAADLVEEYSQKERQDPESLRGILRKLTERQELMEHLINRDLNDLKNSNKDRGDDPKLVELKKEVIQLKQSQHELKDCFEKFQTLVKECTLSREDYVTRREWEQFKQQVETNTAKVSDYEQSTEKVMNTMGDLLNVIGEHTGDKGFSFASKYVQMADQFRLGMKGLRGPAGTSKDDVEHKRSSENSTGDKIECNSGTGTSQGSWWTNNISKPLRGRQGPADGGTTASVSLPDSQNSSIPRSMTPSSDVSGNRPAIHKPLSAQTTANDAPQGPMFQEKLEDMPFHEKRKLFEQHSGNP